MKLFLTKLIAKKIYLLSKMFNFGSGLTWSGHIALKLYPNILQDSNFKFNKGLIFITGTNGKTTTTKLLSHVLKERGNTVVTNATGANLINGVVSSLLVNLSLFGNTYDYGVFEIDEFHLVPLIVNHGFVPTSLVLLNLSRDQLDRYGETDIIINRWSKMLRAQESQNLSVFYYSKDTSFISLIENTSSSSQIETIPFAENEALLNKTILKGFHNATNIDACFKVASYYGVSESDFVSAIKDFDSAYGRGEVLDYKNKSYHIYLAKNPVSFNSNLVLLRDYAASDTCLLFVLNDNIPDGLDVSWIYDIKAGLLNEHVAPYDNVFVCGTRGLDMAVRLQYADVDISVDNVFYDVSSCIKHIDSLSDIKNVVVLPNYSAMLEVRKKLLGRSIL